MCDIAVDEEITVSYLDSTLLIASERKDWIESLFHFDCRCKVCSMSQTGSAESEANRAHIKTTFEGWDTLPIDEWYSSAMSLQYNKLQTLREMDKIEEIIKQEHLPRFLPRLLEYRFQVHAAWGEYEEAKRVGDQWALMEKKIGDKEANKIGEIRKNPRIWGEWGKLRELSARVVIAGPSVIPSVLYGRKTSG
jgi:hypothetical protein